MPLVCALFPLVVCVVIFTSADMVAPKVKPELRTNVGTKNVGGGKEVGKRE